MTDISIRIMTLLTGNTDRDIASAKQYIEDIKAGKIGVAMSTPFMEGLKTQPYGEISGKILTQLIELQQYYKASMFNDIGLNSNYNMKRETIVSAEIELNADALFPFVDNMLISRKLALKEVNEMFGTDISVELASSWEDLADSREIQDILEEAEALAALDGGDTTVMEQGLDSSQLDYENTEVSPEQDGDSSQLESEEPADGESIENDSNSEDNSVEEVSQQEEQNPVSDATEEIQEALIERLAEVVDEHDEEHVEVEEEVAEIIDEAESEEESSRLEEESEDNEDVGDEEEEKDSE